MPDEVVLGADGAVDSHQTARNVVAKVIEAQTTPAVEGEPAPVVEPIETSDLSLESVESAEPVEQVVEGAEKPAEGEPVVTEPAVELEITDEVYDELLSYGVDLGVPPSQVDQALRPVYDRMADSVVRIVTEARSKQLEAQESQMQVQDFMKRIETNPNDILMLVALHQPDRFNEAVEMFERIQEDPRERALVEKELELRARDEQIKRQQNVYQTDQASQKASRVRAQINKTAARYGVDAGLAESWIVAEVRTNGDISPTRVDEIIRQLRPKTSRSPETQRLIQQTPTQPTTGDPAGGVATPAEPEPSPGLQRRSVSTIRDAVKSAIKRH